MIALIKNLWEIIVWLFAIYIFVGGILMGIENYVEGTEWDEFMAVIGVVVAVIVVVLVYRWTESVKWCLLASGVVFVWANESKFGRGVENPYRDAVYESCRKRGNCETKEWKRR